MNVITSRPIYSNADAKMDKALIDVSGKSKQEIQALKEAERTRVKSERVTDRANLKAERDANLAAKKSNRVEARTTRKTERIEARSNRKAKRNAKKLLRLRNKQGKEQILFPLTRLRRNKDNKLVKTYPDGTETIVKPEMAVKVTTIEPTPTGNVTKVIEVDKAEVAEVLQVPIETVTPQLIEQKKVEVPVAQAPIQAQETKTIGTENVIGITMDPGNVTTDENGVSYASTQTQNQEEPIADVVDTNTTEEKKGMSLGVKIGIGVGIAAIIGTVVYFIYKSTKKAK